MLCSVVTRPVFLPNTFARCEYRRAYAKFAATVFEDFSHVSLHCVHIITLHGNNGRTLNRHARLTHARINAEEVEELVSNLIQIRQNCPGSNAAATTLPDRVWMMFSGNFNQFLAPTETATYACRICVEIAGISSVSR